MLTPSPTRDDPSKIPVVFKEGVGSLTTEMQNSIQCIIERYVTEHVSDSGVRITRADVS